MEKQKPYWFVRKRYGWGWTPSGWQGWLVLGLYTGGIISLLTKVDRGSDGASDPLINWVPQALLLTVVLLAITYIKGEKRRRQRGDTGEKLDKK